MERDNIVIGSRGSKLALIYAENVKAKLKEVFSKDIEIKKLLLWEMKIKKIDFLI